MHGKSLVDKHRPQEVMLQMCGIREEEEGKGHLGEVLGRDTGQVEGLARLQQAGQAHDESEPDFAAHHSQLRWSE